MARRYRSGVGIATLDPGGWAGGEHQIVATAYGCSFAVTVPEPLVEQAVAGLPCGWTPAGKEPPQRSWSLRPDGEGRWAAVGERGVLGTGADAPRALDLLLGEVEAWVVGNAAGVVAIRAGAVAWKEQVIVLPGLPGAGTTTLVSALVQAGATYFSDSYALLTPQGTVLPYPRRFRVPGPGYPDSAAGAAEAEAGAVGPGAAPDVRADAGAVGPGAAPDVRAAGSAALSPAVVALLEHDPMVGWDVRPLSTGHTVLALVDHAMAVHSRPRAVMAHVLAAVRGTTGVTGTRGDSREAAQHILGICAGDR